MSSIGVHDFAIPHGHVQPTRDMVIIRLPMPPKMVGSIHIPQAAQDLAQHNVMTGRIVAMGPLAFRYKNGDGDNLSRQDVEIGDWVVIRPFAGTMLQGGRLYESGGWRYVSSFNDVIGIVPAAQMPDPSTLVWEADNVHAAAPPTAVPAKAFEFDNKK
jgi:co-chaperonin GroES (HSP10)